MHVVCAFCTYIDLPCYFCASSAPTLITQVVSADVKHHVYLLTVRVVTTLAAYESECFRFALPTLPTDPKSCRWQKLVKITTSDLILCLHNYIIRVENVHIVYALY